MSLEAFTRHATLAGRGLNFEPMGFDRAEQDPDWHVDRHREPIGEEQPGGPVPGGLFEGACRVLESYGMADPARIRAVYDPESPLDGRDLLLVGRFLGLRFHMGVRIGGVVQGAERRHGRRVHRFAWHYRTLEGHLERGHMDYEVCKDLDTGVVEFGVRAYSQRATIDNPVVSAGFMLFGRATQLGFYRRSIRRMRALAPVAAADG